MKHLHDVYAPETTVLVEAYNQKLAAVEAERAAIDKERSAVAVDALGGATPAAKLMKTMDALRIRTLQADLDELTAHADLPAIDAAHKADWTKAREEARTAVEIRVVTLNKHADELKLEKAQRHSLILADRERRDHEARAAQATEQIRNGAQANLDIARVEQLKAGIVKQLTR